MHQVVLTVTDVARSAAFYEMVLGVLAFQGDDSVRCISGGSFLFCLQRAPQHRTHTRFDEKRVGLDQIGFAVASRLELETLLGVLAGLGVQTVGIEIDPDGNGEYVCFRDPDNIQVEFYVGDYHDRRAPSGGT